MSIHLYLLGQSTVLFELRQRNCGKNGLGRVVRLTARKGLSPLPFFRAIRSRYKDVPNERAAKSFKSIENFEIEVIDSKVYDYISSFQAVSIIWPELDRRFSDSPGQT